MKENTALGILIFTIIMLSLVYVSVNEAESQTVSEAEARAAFAPCNNEPSFGVTGFTWTNDQDQVITDYVPITAGCMKPGVKAFSLFHLRQDADRIPTASLAKEHVDICVQGLMRTQNQIGTKIGRIEEIQKLSGLTCLLSDPNCGDANHRLMATTLINIRDYWISPFAIEQTNWWTAKPPKREDYLLHFKLCAFGSQGNGNSGLEQWLAWDRYLGDVYLPHVKSNLASLLNWYIQNRRSTTGLQNTINNLR